jgi:hypothetical protein
MRSTTIQIILLLALIPGLLVSCGKKTEDFKTDAISDYVPLAPGKYITYRLDSTVFTNFGHNIEVHKYQVKHVVDSLITDNLGRPSYRIFRYLRDSAGTQPWVPNGSYFITPLTDQLEVIEDNLRFLKIHLPFRGGNSWKGNKYLPSDPYGSLYSFSNDDFMADWDFYMNDPEPSVSYQGNTYNDVYTINEDDEAYNVPIVVDTSYASRTLADEKYAKNIGLVYRDYIMWEHQPNPSTSGNPPVTTYNPYKIGFGITMWMIDHN